MQRFRKWLLLYLNPAVKCCIMSIPWVSLCCVHADMVVFAIVFMCTSNAFKMHMQFVCAISTYFFTS